MSILYIIIPSSVTNKISWDIRLNGYKYLIDLNIGIITKAIRQNKTQHFFFKRIFLNANLSIYFNLI